MITIFGKRNWFSHWKTRNTLFVFAYFIASITLAATSSQAQTASFDDLLEILETHPSIISIEHQAVAETELAKAERGLPDPTLSVGINNVPVNNPEFDRYLPTNKMVGLSQQIPNFGVRKARSERRREVSEVLRLRADYQYARLKAALIGALVDQQKIIGQIEISKRQLELYRELDNILRGELASGQPSYFRFSEVDVERTDVDRRLNDLNNQQKDIQARLFWLVGAAPAIIPPQIKALNWDSSPLSLYPALIADRQVAAARMSVKEGKSAFGPNFGLSLQYLQREEGALGTFAGDDWFSAGASVTIPLWAGTNQTPRLRAARAGEASAKAQYQDIVASWRQSLTSLYSAYATAQKNVKILKDKGHSLSEVIEASQRNYEAGQTGFEQVLDAEISQLTISSQLEDEKARVVKLAAEINSHMVTP